MNVRLSSDTAGADTEGTTGSSTGSTGHVFRAVTPALLLTRLPGAGTSGRATVRTGGVAAVDPSPQDLARFCGLKA